MCEKTQEILTVEEMRQVLKIEARPIGYPLSLFTRGWKIPTQRYIRSNLQLHLNWRFYHGQKKSER